MRIRDQIAAHRLLADTALALILADLTHVGNNGEARERTVRNGNEAYASLSKQRQDGPDVL